jgi:hypothetical protein
MPSAISFHPYYRVLKRMYSVAHVHQNVREAMRNTPMMFGVWHAYAHCVRKTHETFRSLWSALEYPTLLDGQSTPVFAYPTLFTLECMVCGLFLAQPDVTLDIRRCVAQLEHDHAPDHPTVRLARNVHVLINEYIPTLMYLGVFLRHMSWEMSQPGTGKFARRFLVYCLHVLHKLGVGKGEEYVRTIGLAILLWTPYHDSIPASCYVEEPLEASLSRLSRLTGSDLRPDTVRAFALHYLGMGPVDDRPRDLTQPGIKELFPHRLVLRVRRLLRQCALGTVMYVGSRTAGTAYCQPSSTWPTNKGQVVDRAMMQTDVDTMKCALQHALATLVRSPARRPGDISGREVNAVQHFCRRVPDVPEDIVQDRREEARNALQLSASQAAAEEISDNWSLLVSLPLKGSVHTPFAFTACSLDCTCDTQGVGVEDVY